MHAVQTQEQESPGQDDQFTAPPARKDGNGDEFVIALKPLRDNLQTLMQLKIQMDDASALLKEAIKATAEKSGLMSATIRALVNARTKGNVSDKRRIVEQLSIVFDEFGDN